MQYILQDPIPFNLYSFVVLYTFNHNNGGFQLNTMFLNSKNVNAWWEKPRRFEMFNAGNGGYIQLNRI